jgi:hypothetical protein
MKEMTVVAVMVGAVLALAAPQPAMAQVPPSGLVLGVNVFPVGGGLRVNNTFPGFAANGLLFPGDVLVGGWSEGFGASPLRTVAELETFKTQVGPAKVGALRVYRPNVGYLYFWVSFTPVGGTNAYHAQFQSEQQKPGAQAKFQGATPPSRRR